MLSEISGFAKATLVQICIFELSGGSIGYYLPLVPRERCAGTICSLGYANLLHFCFQTCYMAGLWDR
jgi:hypothetical protein